MKIHFILTLQWRYNERDGISNDRRLDSLLNCLLRRRLKKTSKLRITGLCEENPPVTSVFPSQRASNADNVSIWWRHRENFGIFPGSVQKMSLFCLQGTDCSWSTQILKHLEKSRIVEQAKSTGGKTIPKVVEVCMRALVWNVPRLIIKVNYITNICCHT